MSSMIPQLDTLNLNKNFIRRVENISHLGRLTTLLLANNHIETSDDLRHVLHCPSIQVRISIWIQRGACARLVSEG